MAKAKAKTEEVVEEVLSIEEATEQSVPTEETKQVTLNEAPVEVPQTGHATRAFRS